MASGASKLIPSDPDKVMIVRRLTPNLLICSVPFLRFGRIKIGGRGTIVKLRDDSLAVFSPVALTQNVKQQMQEQLGSTNVKYLTALDQEHHIFLEAWHKEYPQAKVIAPETLPELRNKQGYFKIPDENWRLVKASETGGKGVSVDATFDAEFEGEYVPAHGNKELVFCHKPTRTLIEADFMFNLPATEQHSRTGDSATTGWLTRLFNSINSTQGTAIWQKRLIWYAIAQDKKAYGESVKTIAKWDFDRIVPCHGDVIETGGKGIFEKVNGWFLEGKKSS